ncbi:MAG TPA: NADH-quinone oxidoreductase subunit NuoN [Patescibacteria group bacterium]|nr:NADH-quinone oxidoreductase subunit NuoN [Patescibacteria group bacterium]
MVHNAVEIAISMADIRAMLPELFLLASAFVILMADLYIPQQQRSVTHWLSISVLVVAGVLVWRSTGDDTLARTAFNGMYVRDEVAALCKLFILGSTALAYVYARPHLKPRGMFQGEFYTLSLFAVIGMMLLVSAGNMLSAYLGLEMLALCSYALVALNRDSPLSSEAAMKYFVLGVLASGLLLYGMSMVYGATGTLDLGSIRAVASSNVPRPELLVFGVVFLVIGIAFKFGAAPFHAWVPDVYQGSPTGVTLFVASAPKVAAFGLAYRLLDNGLGTAALWSNWSAMLSVLAVLSLVIGNIVAIAQTNLKRMLAYSTISHVGFLLLGIIGGGADGFGAALFYATTYSITAVAAFGLIVLLSRAGFEAEEIEDFRGLNQRNPFYAFLVLVVMASFAGIPLFVGFLAKLQVLKAVIRADALWLAIVGALCAVIGAYYYLRVIKVMYFDAPASNAPVIASADHSFRIVLSANVLALMALGIFGGPLMTWCLSAVAAS